VGGVEPLELLSRRVHVIGLRARGVAFHMAQASPDGRGGREPARGAASDRGCALEPYAGLASRPPKKRTGGP